MPITTDRNCAYGNDIVTQKYSPLLNIQYQAVDQPLYTRLITNRAGNLRAANRLGRPLTLATPNWANVVNGEAAHLPPLVVISSDRSNWIRAGIDAARLRLLELNLPAFANASDLRALNGVAIGQSPPIYTPTRVGANRNVYIVVHMTEYSTYKRVLSPLNIIPVGYEFDNSGGGPSGLRLVGFGASRFAAMEFCKTLRQLTATAAGGIAPWNYAWLLDDNVVALSPFPGFTAIEETLNANVVCAGFQGGAAAETYLTNNIWARAEIAAGRGVQTAVVPASVTPAIVQQMSLWNVDYLQQHQLNFGPIYITSAEDLSITNYFDHHPIPYRHYGGIAVRKETAEGDNSFASKKLKSARQRIAKFVTDAEAATPPGGQPPPPPVQIQPSNLGDGGVQSVARFIVNRVLPNAPALALSANDVNVQNTAKCQAVEQIASDAIGHGFVAAAGNDASFRINGANNQVVVQRDV